MIPPCSSLKTVLGISQQALGSEQLSTSSQSHNVSCQMDSIETLPAGSPKTRSIGTQLSFCTLKDTHARNKGILHAVAVFMYSIMNALIIVECKIVENPVYLSVAC